MPLVFFRGVQKDLPVAARRQPPHREGQLAARDGVLQPGAAVRERSRDQVPASG
jgi:hypothetical protein